MRRSARRQESDRPEGTPSALREPAHRVRDRSHARRRGRPAAAERPLHGDVVVVLFIPRRSLPERAVAPFSASQPVVEVRVPLHRSHLPAYIGLAQSYFVQRPRRRKPAPGTRPGRSPGPERRACAPRQRLRTFGPQTDRRTSAPRSGLRSRAPQAGPRSRAPRPGLRSHCRHRDTGSILSSEALPECRSGAAKRTARLSRWDKRRGEVRCSVHCGVAPRGATIGVTRRAGDRCACTRD